MSVAYQSRNGQGNSSSSEEETEEQRANRNNANNVRNAADVAIATKNPYAVAAGSAVKAADKVTGGKASEALGRSLTRMNKMAPGGKRRQKQLNNLNESGAGDKIGKAASMMNQVGSKGKPSDANKSTQPSSGEKPNKNLNNPTANNSQNNGGASTGGGQGGSSPSSGGGIPRKHILPDKDSDNNSSDSNSKSSGTFFGMGTMGKIIVGTSIAGFLFIIIFIFIIMAIISTTQSSFDDALGISQEMGEETGNYQHSGSPDQNAFYKRINDVKLSYQANGKSVDGLKIVAVYTILKNNGANVSYNKFTTPVIEEIADAMFDENNTYSKETFKNNLINNIFPKYLPDASEGKRKAMANAVFTYIDNYYSLIGKTTSSTGCSSTGSCSYEIKGYYINGKGNVTAGIEVNNLYVRLMQCGSGNGHNYGGTFGQPLEGEELVPFEKYILGVAYQEIGPTSPKEAIKAQMVAARSYILARHADMGGWRTLKEESDGKWVLQVASCTQDQVYCDPDQGCSATDGQWGQIHSGLGHGSFQRNPMAADSPLRTYASETAGEVLVNAQGYIVYSGYVQTEQNKFISLAKSGLDYKQILLQVYNQGSRNYGATGIQKNNCGGSQCVAAASGDYANWRQNKGSWVNVQLGNSGKTISQIGCLVTSVSIQIARSGVPTNISNFNPGTFVEYLNSHGGFASGGNFVWGSVSSAAPTFRFVGKESLSGLSRSDKLNKINSIISQPNTYAVVEVKGNTGQHWVAIDRVEGSTVYMMDPASDKTDMWGTYNWTNTSSIAYFRAG